MPLVLFAEDNQDLHEQDYIQSSLVTNDIFNLSSNFNMNSAETRGESNRIDCMIQPFSMVEVASSSSGIVDKMNVDRGSLVNKDQVIAVLESSVEKTNAEHSAAKYKFLKKKYERLLSLYDQKVLSYHELQEADAEQELAKIESRRTVELLRLRTITSPFSGIVIDKYISPGELTDQQKVVKIAQVNPLKVEVIAPVEIYGSVQKGMKANIFPEGPKTGPFEAEVDIVDQVVDAASGTFGIRLILQNPQFDIPAGLKCSAKFISKGKGLRDQAKNKMR